MDLEHQRCYIYQPPEDEERAPKRQRIEQSRSQPQLAERLQIYRDLWAAQDQRIQATLEEADSATQGSIVDFVSASGSSPDEPKFAIPTGLVVAGPSIASHGPYFERLGHNIRSDTDSAYVLLNSGECPNLKTLLKVLIKKATSRLEDEDEDDLDQPKPSRRGPKLLNYDLGHIQEWRKKNRVSSVVVTIQDSEAFDAGLLIDLIDLLHSWLDRIPFVLLFGIATSADSFEDRISGKSLRYLEGERFDVTQSDDIIEKLFSATVASLDNRLFIGPQICRRMLDRQKDYVQNVQDFCDGLKYAYMSHFYPSVPTIFLDSTLELQDIDAGAFAAIRNLPSFRRHIEKRIEQGPLARQIAGSLLRSDRELFEAVKYGINLAQDELTGLNHAVQVLFSIREALQMTPRVKASTIWLRALSAELLDSPILRETMLSLKKTPSDKFASFLSALSELSKQREMPYEGETEQAIETLDVSSIQAEFNTIVQQQTTSAPLRTEHDVQNASVRATVVAQKVLLSKHKAALSKQDQAYSDLVTRVHRQLASFFELTLVEPQALLFSEVFMYDLKSPHLEVFQPKPRFAIERALASPHDYLGCDCCGTVDGKESVLGATQPATAIVYQMYLESGALINVTDLWSAFKAIAGNDDGEDESITM
ncbi:origin recognition complex subunit [Boeremia exigua]|uniref:origin recognition complex subunit n=1 Tax=Boeremia exigua TaxID=749465 RepID=UPI001E8E8081|nr:origin recognition complex subunit [Boeremia exigua]KAH6638314.1 origin recognition complex subunit [Boeremia exigua]